MVISFCLFGSPCQWICEVVISFLFFRSPCFLKWQFPSGFFRSPCFWSGNFRQVFSGHPVSEVTISFLFSGHLASEMAISFCFFRSLCFREGNFHLFFQFTLLVNLWSGDFLLFFSGHPVCEAEKSERYFMELGKSLYTTPSDTVHEWIFHKNVCCFFF